MNYSYLLYKLFFTIFLSFTLFVYGQECTISTKWSLCECVNGFEEEVQHDIITNDTEKYREFTTNIDGDNTLARINFGTVQSGEERKIIFNNYPSKEFEPFICQYDDINNWSGFQFVDVGKNCSGKQSFVYTVNCRSRSNICINMPYSHRCRQLQNVFKELDVDKLKRLKRLKRLDGLNLTKKAVINCNVAGKALHIG